MSTALDLRRELDALLERAVVLSPQGAEIRCELEFYAEAEAIRYRDLARFLYGQRLEVTSHKGGGWKVYEPLEMREEPSDVERLLMEGGELGAPEWDREPTPYEEAMEAYDRGDV